MIDSSTIKAGCVHIQNNDEFVLVGFADRKNDTEQYVLLQRTVHPSGADVALGQDSIHIEVGDQARACYGGVLGAKVTAGCVEISLSDQAAKIIRTGPKLRIQVADPEFSAAQIAEGLKAVFGEYAEVTVS